MRHSNVSHDIDLWYMPRKNVSHSVLPRDDSEELSLQAWLFPCHVTPRASVLGWLFCSGRWHLQYQVIALP